MSNTLKFGLLAGMTVLAVLAVSGNASAFIIVDHVFAPGAGECNGLFPVYTCIAQDVPDIAGRVLPLVHDIECNYVGAAC